MVLNLAYPEKSTVKYEKIKYADNQVSIKLTPGYVLDSHIWIKSRMNSYEDLFYILSATEALQSMNKQCSLIVTCFLSQRSDRRFFEGQSFDLKIMSRIINAQNYRNVKLIHPHSDVLPALIDNSEVISSQEYVAWAVVDIERTINEEVILVSPDAGAYKQVYKYGEVFRRNVVSGNKSRDLLSGDVHLDINGSVHSRTCLIVDDYCDGGRTFTGLAIKLKELGASKVYLYVTHGLFSYGLEVFREIIDGVYCTNSINNYAVTDELIGYSFKQFEVI